MKPFVVKTRNRIQKKSPSTIVLRDFCLEADESWPRERSERTGSDRWSEEGHKKAPQESCGAFAFKG